MMIKCPECGKEISDMAYSCPSCGYVIRQSVQMGLPEEQVKSKKVKKKNSTLSILAAIFALFTWTYWIGLILAIIDFIKNKNDGRKHLGSWFAIIFSIVYILASMATSDGGSQDGKGEMVAVNSESETSNSDSSGSKVEVGGQFDRDGLKVTINSADTDFTDYEDEYGYYKPGDGKKYIKVAFTYENNGDSDKYVSIYDCDCYADGTLCEQTYNFGGDFINANISPGRNVSFDTYYVVPQDAASIELEYKENVWNGDKIVIEIE